MWVEPYIYNYSSMDHRIAISVKLERFKNSINAI